jgi:hypothetical protein
MGVPRHYKLWFDDSDPLAAICTRAELRGVSEYFVYQPEPIDEWPSDVTFYTEGEHLEDRLIPAPMNWILVSVRVKKALQKMEIEGVQFLPVRVVRQETEEEVRGYHVLHVWRQLSALDEEHTVRLVPKQEDCPQLGIAKVALRREVIGDVDMFRLEDWYIPVYVSRRVKELLQAIKVTGFKWIPVPEY